jgi:hypothetical protein
VQLALLLANFSVYVAEILIEMIYEVKKKQQTNISNICVCVFSFLKYDWGMQTYG